MTSQSSNMLGTFGRNRGHSGRTATDTFIFMFNQGDIGSTIKLFETYFNVKRVNVLLFL